ncbi:MAG: hypothetical protein R6U15_03745 [Candidatus Izemoplasmatales bacterium]
MSLEEIADDGIKINETSEIGEVFNNLDADGMSEKTKLPRIDVNTRISELESRHLAIFDNFKQIGFIPKWSNLGMSIKRLNVSIRGEGRKEKERIATAKRESSTGQNALNFVGDLFKPRGN